MQLPMTTAAVAYRNPAASKPYLSSYRGAEQEAGAKQSIALYNKKNTPISPQDGRNARSQLLSDAPSTPRLTPPSVEIDASAIAVGDASPLRSAAPQSPRRTGSAELPREKRWLPSIQSTPSGPPQAPSRPLSSSHATVPSSMVRPIKGVSSDIPSFAPVVKIWDSQQDHRIIAIPPSMPESRWTQPAQDRVGATSSTQAPQQGTIHLDGNALGQWMTRHLERMLLQPERGPTALDTRVVPDWRAANVGY